MTSPNALSDPAPFPPASPTVDAFLAAVLAGGGIPATLYAADAVLDATVPGWRIRAEGAAAIAKNYGSWFADPGAFEEIERHPLPGGELVRYVLTWTERGVPHAAHHCHVIELDGHGHIARDTVFCGGRWNAGLLAEMAAADSRAGAAAQDRP